MKADEIKAKIDYAMEMDDEKKFEILKTLYSFLFPYHESSIKRIIDILKGGIGIQIIIDGWIIALENALPIKEKLFIAIGLIIFSIIALLIMRNYFRDYLLTAILIVQIEKTWGLYENDLFVKDETLFPISYKEWPQSSFSSKIFWHKAFALIAFSVFSICLIIFH